MSSILVVDDESKTVRVLKLALERAGYEVMTARDGEEALKLLRDDCFDVLITDLNMPRVGGDELCQTIVRDMPGREPLIFVLTGRPGASTHEWAEGIPNLEFLEKPVSLRKLVGRVQERLGAADSEHRTP